MVRYSKFQFGWIVVCVFTITIVLMTFAYINHWGNHPVDKAGYILFMILFGSVLSIFCGMTVMVTDEELIIKLGIGLFRKKVRLSEVVSVRRISYPVYYGYGIRFIPNGILYNVSGRSAVELRFRDRKKVLLIGSSDCDKLLAAIEQGIRI
jgi:hypothetical protein